MSLLVFDPRVEGHHTEYLLHIARYVSKSSASPDLYFAVNPDIKIHCPELVRIEGASDSISLLPLNPDEYYDPENASSIRRSLAGWESAMNRAVELDVDHCMFMELNIYQAVLGLPRSYDMPFSVSGILFFPYCRIEPGGGILSQIKSMVEKLRKMLQVRWMISNSIINTIFVLNDHWGARNMNDHFGTDIFRFLPDPVPSLQIDENESDHVASWSRKWWGPDRVHFLLFGSLRREKGVLEAIQAFCKLSRQEAQLAAFHLLGAPREELEAHLFGLVSKLQEEQPELHIHFEGRFLSESELDCALSHSDVILAPYQRVEGSSGVLGHSANYRTPVIGAKTGLIGYLIEEYDLGVTVDSSSPERLRKVISAYLQGDKEKRSTAGMKRYVSERTPDDFAEKLLSVHSKTS
jgi:glycosyltransferase involved in cell wall biosynthesis